MNRRVIAIAALLCVLLLAACGTAEEPEAPEHPVIPAQTTTEESNMKLWINETEIPVTWEQNDAVAALQLLAQGEGLEISMSMYGGFEQVGSIGQSLPRDDRQITTGPGDIVLYSGNQIVLFYGSNAWSYTRLGHMELPQQELRELLGSADVTIRIREG